MLLVVDDFVGPVLNLITTGGAEQHGGAEGQGTYCGN